ncbi:MAG: hypothetical protein K1X35_07740 [Caulobacteraceae bacterium]|nr:hypothetical protein [Caulobacteraceae bacterium]
MPLSPLREILVRTVKQWKSGSDRGDVAALVRQLDANLSPLVEPVMPRVPRHR